ncbi:hypothetical protein ACFWR9_09000 [Streptomyces sp. NPDC058534]|uniref:zinc finger domain-containing protein n=1 Tax=Streptomyces sp. NPDC058534 TaxID=3346541 RepID=UPI0036626D99
MNEYEAAELLGHCAAFDNRKPSIAARVAWAAALHDVPLDQDARDAVAAYYTTAPKDPDTKLWILPHHVRTLRTKIRNTRLENFQYEPVPDETTGQYLARLRGQVKAIASGRVATPTARPALEGGPTKQFMKELEACGWQGNRTIPDTDQPTTVLADTVRRAGPLGIVCPDCRAAIGFPCKTSFATRKHPLGRPLLKPHSARVRTAAGEQLPSAAERAAQEDRVRQMSAAALARLAEEPVDAEIVEDAS